MPPTIIIYESHSSINVGRDTFDKDECTMVTEFKRNMLEVLRKEQLTSINDFELVFIPMAESHHYYLMCFNIKTMKSILIDNSASVEYEAKYLSRPEKWYRDAFASYLDDVSHPNAKHIKESKITRFEMPWRTSHNDLKEQQQFQLDDLRRKYAAKILLNDVNEVKSYVVEDMKKYLNLPPTEKRKLKKNATQRIYKRLNEHLF
ncbi:hypothetical protein R6Q57_008790 [Mikania cordata]